MATPHEVRRSIEAVWRLESARLLGGLVRMVRDLDLAEDLAHEALVAALETWPRDGIPDRPGAWLMTTAKNRALDRARRSKVRQREHDALAAEAPSQTTFDPTTLDEHVGDDLLRLILIACHPVLSSDARVSLTLRLVVGLTVEEIARAYMAAETTIQQRIVRAKRTLREARAPFEVPRGAELTARLESVMQVVYLIFNEGYASTRGPRWLREELSDDALRLGRTLAALVPDEAEVQGLLALMELSASRARARLDADGRPVLLLDQNRALWDRLQIGRGLAALARAESLASPLGPYTLQAAINACHARAARAEDTDWRRIVALYDALVEATGNPVVELNRAMAVAMAYGPADGLALVDQLIEDGELQGYHWLPSVRGELLARLGRHDEARAELHHAAELTQNERERESLLARAARLA
ncbi:MAG: RNA polymerase sigma factor [Sandaracinaceae bacterium]